MAPFIEAKIEAGGRRNDLSSLGKCLFKSACGNIM
jgi:hypothetical protein